MIIYKNAVADTLGSSDILVAVQPAERGMHIELQSTVYQQLGDDIIKTIREVTESLGVEAVPIQANSHGVLDCTIRARVGTAPRRALREEIIRDVQCYSYQEIIPT